MVVGAFMLTGCQIENPISVDSIRDNSTIIDYFEIQGFWNIDDIIMETRQTDKDERTDDLYCQIVVNDTKIKKIGEYEIISNYYDEGGWIIDDIIELSCYYEPIEEPDFFEIVYGYDCQYVDYRGVDRRVEYPPEIGKAICNSYDADRIVVTEVEWPLDDHGDEIWGKISYSEVYEYNNFRKEDYYNLYVCFDTSNGIWQARTNEFAYSEYLDLCFEGQYVYRPSGMYMAGDDGTYVITFRNCSENGLGADLSIEGTIDGGIWDEDCNIQQQGGTYISGYDMQDLPEELREVADTYFEEPVRSRPGILFKVQCSGMTCGSPDEIEDVYVLVSIWDCYLLVRQTGYMRSYRVLDLKYNGNIYSEVAEPIEVNVPDWYVVNEIVVKGHELCLSGDDGLVMPGEVYPLTVTHYVFSTEGNPKSMRYYVIFDSADLASRYAEELNEYNRDGGTNSFGLKPGDAEYYSSKNVLVADYQEKYIRNNVESLYEEISMFEGKGWTINYIMADVS